MNTHKLVTVPLASLVAVGVMLGVSACNPLAAVTEQAVEQAVEEATGGNIDIDAGGGVSIPADFPAEIPLIDAKLTTAGGLGSDGAKTWSLLYTVSDPKAAFDEAAKLLTGAGYTVSFEQDMGETKLGTYDNGTWNVSLVNAPAVGGEGATLTYVVAASAGMQTG